MDAATILVSTSTMRIPVSLQFRVNDQLVTLRLLENNTEVELAEDDDQDDLSSKSCDDGDSTSFVLEFQKILISRLFRDLITMILRR